jgi:hypothetical protein
LILIQVIIAILLLDYLYRIGLNIWVFADYVESVNLARKLRGLVNLCIPRVRIGDIKHVWSRFLISIALDVIFKAVFNLNLIAYNICLLPSGVWLIFVSLKQLLNLVILRKIVVKDIVDFIVSVIPVGIIGFNFVGPLVVYLSRWIFHKLVVVKDFTVLTDLLYTLSLALIDLFNFYEFVPLNQFLSDFLVEWEELRQFNWVFDLH